MAYTLRPLRDYSEHDVVNFFAVDNQQDANGVIATAGTVVKVTGNGFQPVSDTSLGGGTGFLGQIPVDLGGTLGIPGLSNVVSNRYVVTAKVAPAVAQDTAPIGITLMATQELDENGEKLIFKPGKAAEKGVVVSGQAVPVLTRGVLVYSGSTSDFPATANVGAAIYVAAGSLSCSAGAKQVGTLLSKPINGIALVKLNF
jgi:hypothetical protein